jgi:chemotaxis protein histidine kinase CheA
MGGVIKVETELGEGAKFTLQLPTVVESVTTDANTSVIAADANPGA